MPVIPATEKTPPAPSGARPVPFGSHDVRLSPREWLVAGAIAAAAFWAIPIAWQRIEPFEPPPDYRIPYSLSEDYWMYARYCRRVCSQGKAIVLGDSVIWGHYVTGDRTLPHYLNELARSERFANLAVDGIHPAAMAGLVDCYGRSIAGKRVLLLCNPLWTSSDEADLRGTKEARINHPRLIPQFAPPIPSYEEPYEVRLGVVVQRYLPLLGWTNHLRSAYFASNGVPADVAAWTRENPYANPLRAITLELPSSGGLPPDAEAEAWTAKGIERRNYPWVDLQTSIQWSSFRRTVEILEGRGNRVFVLVGPFNEHMLKDESLAKYRRLKGEIASWLRQKEILHHVARVLPSELYADASHPLAAGYALLARQLWEDESFAGFRQGD